MILVLLALLATVLLTIALTVPFLSLVIRFRAHYAPLAVSLSDPSAPSPAYTGPQIRGIIHLFSRIRAQEGIAGLYKGVCPVLLESVLGGVGSMVYWGLTSPGMGAGAGTSYAVSPHFGLWAFGWAVISLLLNLPMTIIINRAICTPYRLPYSPLRSLRLLLSQTELRAPWRLYLLPGLLPTKLLHIAYLVLILPAFRAVLFPSYHPPDTDDSTWGGGEGGEAEAVRLGVLGTVGVVAYVVFLLASTTLLCPLEIIALRLSLQPLSPTPVHPAAPGLGTNVPSSDEPPLFGTEEDVISLRTPETGGEPYEGMIDCWRKVRREEGGWTLGRAAWLTGLATLGAGFS